MSIILRHNLCCEVLLWWLLLWKSALRSLECSTWRSGNKSSLDSLFGVVEVNLSLNFVRLDCSCVFKTSLAILLTHFKVSLIKHAQRIRFLDVKALRSKTFFPTTSHLWLHICTNVATNAWPLTKSLVSTVSRPDWKYSSGFVNLDMIKNHLPAPSTDVLVVLCGPPPMIQYACMPNLEKLGHKTQNIFAY